MVGLIGMARVGKGTEVDAETVQMLQSFPADLRERGWALVIAESRVMGSVDGPRYRAVYVRPFVDRLDLERGSAATYDPQTRQRIFRVSTLNDQSASWHDARQDAIRRMREAEAKYRRKR